MKKLLLLFVLAISLTMAAQPKQKNMQLNFAKEYIYYLPYEDEAYLFNANGTGIKFFDTSIVAECIETLVEWNEVTVNTLPFTWKRKSANIITITTKGDYPTTYDVRILNSNTIKVKDKEYILTKATEIAIDN